MTPPRDDGDGAAALLVKGLFVDLAGVLLDTAPAHGQVAGLRAGVGAALRLLDRLDYRILVLAPCARDRRQASHMPLARVADLLVRERIHLAGICGCSADAAPCAACPPAPDSLRQAARDYGIDLAASWLLASGARHCTAGQLAGCRTLLVAGDGARWPPAAMQGAGTAGPAGYVARDIVDAALAIVRLDGDA
jgi:beta-phosphoglucomutase-like phosphatase (HAD superfamily)